MVTEIRYTTKDLKRLQSIINGKIEAELAFNNSKSILIFSMNDKIILGTTNDRISNYYKDGKFISKFTDKVEMKQPTQYLKAYVNIFNTFLNGSVAHDIYHFLFYVKFEDVPTYSYDVYLNLFGFLQWRLEIGK